MFLNSCCQFLSFNWCILTIYFNVTIGNVRACLPFYYLFSDSYLFSLSLCSFSGLSMCLEFYVDLLIVLFFFFLYISPYVDFKLEILGIPLRVSDLLSLPFSLTRLFLSLL